MKKYYISMLLVVLCLGSVYADSARIPIYEQTTITEPGHYYLTRDIAVSGTTAITISASNVDLDLNGFTITNSTSSGHAVAISDGASFISIYNGIFIGGNCGVYYISPTNRITIFVEDVNIINNASTGMYLSGVEYVLIRNCVLRGAGGHALYLHGVSESFRGEIVGNKVALPKMYGILCSGLSGGIIENNVISGFGSDSVIYKGLHLTGEPAWTDLGGTIIRNNAISGGGSNDSGLHIDPVIPRNRIVGNNVTNCGAQGIWVESQGNTILENTAGACGGAGISVSGLGFNNLIDNNICEGNTGFGISAGDTSNNYRNNMIKNNTGGSVMGGTDAGGNIL